MRVLSNRAARALCCLIPLAFGACKGEPPLPAAEQTEVPEGLARFEGPSGVADTGLGTPREQRVATIGVLNKRNNLTQDLKIKPGESRRAGDVIVRLATCERTAPWETPPETGAFLQVLVAHRRNPEADPEWQKIFSGWLFKNSPSLNVVEHPIYDVWVKDCTMSFPGEETPLPTSPRSAANPSGSPPAAPSASPGT